MVHVLLKIYLFVFLLYFWRMDRYPNALYGFASKLLYLMRYSISFLFVMLSLAVYAGENLRIQSKLATYSMAVSGETAPLWLYAGQEGRWGISGEAPFLGIVTVSGEYRLGDDFSFSGHLEADYNSAQFGGYIHSYSLGIDWKSLSLKAGRHVFNPIFEDGYKGSGSFMFGNNARPMDRIIIGIPEYTGLPGIFRRLEIKGGMSHGFMDDPYRGAVKYHRDVVLHEKYAYMRWDGGKWKPYAGLNHSVLMGGYYSNGEKIPIDFWNSIFAKGSSKLGGGEMTNAAGAHMGLYDLGLYYSRESGEFHLYYQMPFADGSGMKPFVRNRDQIAGITWTSSKRGLLSALTLEWINTTYQSGKGMPDAYFYYTDESGAVKSRLVVLYQLEDPAFREDVMRKLGVENPGSYTIEEAEKYLKENTNYGYSFGGRDWYMNNGLYPAGWTHYGMVMGSPFVLSYPQVAHLEPELGAQGGYYQLVNDRFRAIHIGGAGALSEKLTWDLMMSYTRNYGSYVHQYPGRYTWNETPGYFFKGGKDQFYSRIGFAWEPSVWKGFCIRGALGADYGQLSESLGIYVGLIKQFR